MIISNEYMIYDISSPNESKLKYPRGFDHIYNFKRCSSQMNQSNPFISISIIYEYMLYRLESIPNSSILRILSITIISEDDQSR